MKEKLMKEIENKRKMLEKSVSYARNSRLTEQQVINLSRELDEMIIEFQRIR